MLEVVKNITQNTQEAQRDTEFLGILEVVNNIIRMPDSKLKEGIPADVASW